MNILIVAEKRSVSHALLSSLQRTRCLPVNAKLTVIQTNALGFFRFDYPTVVHAELPCVTEVIIKPRHYEHGAASYIIAWTGSAGELYYRDTINPHQIYNSKTEYIEGDVPEILTMLLNSADIIVKATDNGYRGAAVFRNILNPGDHIYSDFRYSSWRITDMKIHSLNADYQDSLITQGLRDNPDSMTWKEDELLNYANAKDYFDYNSNINALTLLSEPLQRVDIPQVTGNTGTALMLSKWTLQWLLHINEEGNRTWKESEAISLMAKWQGTGKYPALTGNGVEYGSTMSRAAIPENLYNLKLISRLVAGQGTFILTEKGYKPAGLLPKSARDPDLPFRLHKWCSDLPLSKPAMNAYIMRYRGNIKRSNGMNNKAETYRQENSEITAMSETSEHLSRTAQIAPDAARRYLDGKPVSARELRSIHLAQSRRN